MEWQGAKGLLETNAHHSSFPAHMPSVQPSNRARYRSASWLATHKGNSANTGRHRLRKWSSEASIKREQKRREIQVEQPCAERLAVTYPKGARCSCVVGGPGNHLQVSCTGSACHQQASRSMRSRKAPGSSGNILRRAYSIKRLLPSLNRLYSRTLRQSEVSTMVKGSRTEPAVAETGPPPLGTRFSRRRTVMAVIGCPMSLPCWAGDVCSASSDLLELVDTSRPTTSVRTYFRVAFVPHP